MAVITALSINTLIDAYNSELGLSLPNVNVGDEITAAFFLNMHTQVRDAAEYQGRAISLPNPSSFAKGQVIKLEAWGMPGPALEAKTESYFEDGSFVVPQGVNKIMVNWLVAAGGGGGASTEWENGGGGGGGGSGGHIRYRELNVTPGQILRWTIGQGGVAGVRQSKDTFLPTADGGDGGNTILYIASNKVLEAVGGKGGKQNRNARGNTPTAGGVAGTPDGLPGGQGQAGYNDYASAPGGPGAPGPVSGCYGGAGGNTGGGSSENGPSTGKAGVGPGSGGGGGGSRDRTNPWRWYGGPGAKGFIEFTYPSQGAVGGTPAQGNTNYNPGTSAGQDYTGGYSGGGNGGGNLGNLDNVIRQNEV